VAKTTEMITNLQFSTEEPVEEVVNQIEAIEVVTEEAIMIECQLKPFLS